VGPGVASLLRKLIDQPALADTWLPNDHGKARPIGVGGAEQITEQSEFLRPTHKRVLTDSLSRVRLTLQQFREIANGGGA
jgi:hypothetical protein